MTLAVSTVDRAAGTKFYSLNLTVHAVHDRVSAAARRLAASAASKLAAAMPVLALLQLLLVSPPAAVALVASQELPGPQLLRSRSDGAAPCHASCSIPAAMPAAAWHASSKAILKDATMSATVNCPYLSGTLVMEQPAHKDLAQYVLKTDDNETTRAVKSDNEQLPATQLVLRIEGPLSIAMNLWEVEVLDTTGRNVMLGCAPKCVLDGCAADAGSVCNEVYQGRLTFGGCSCSPLFNATNIRGKPDGNLRRLTDGVVFSPRAHKTREYDSNTGDGSTQSLGVFLEFELPPASNNSLLDNIRIFTAHGYMGTNDCGWRSVILLEQATRKVVAMDTFLPSAKICTGPTVVTTQPTRGLIWNCSRPIKYLGKPNKTLVIPRSALNWRPLYDVLPPSEPIPPVSDEKHRLATFMARDADAEVQRLADEMFKQGKLLRNDDTAAAFALYGRGDSRGALNAWKEGWFKMLARKNYHWSYQGNDAITYSFSADDLMHNFSVAFGKSAPMQTPMLHSYTLGAMNWMKLADGLAANQKLAFVGGGWDGGALFARYKTKRDPAYLVRWSSLLDDWLINFFQDADAANRAGVNVKNIFVMTAAGAWTRLLEDLSDLNVEQNISHIIPATTLARMQLRLCAEYLPAYWRVARSTYFNHDTSGLLSNYVLSRYIGDFFAGERLTNEIRDHFTRWLRFGQTHFGSMIEIDDEGHWTMPIRGMGLIMKFFDNDKPAFWNAALRTEGVDMYRRQMQYYFRHASQAGFFYRIDHDYPAPALLFNFTNPSRDYHMFNCKNHSIPYISDGDPYIEPEVQNVIWQVYGAGHQRPNASLGSVSRQRQQLWDSASIVLAAAKANGSTHVPTTPAIRTDTMPFAGLFYVRGGWEPSDLLLHCIATPGLGDNSYNGCSYEASSCQAWEWGIETLGCQLLLGSFPSAMMRMPYLDGQAPMPYFQTKGFNPGSKTNGLSYAALQPARGRFYSGSAGAGVIWDVVEPTYAGAWATLNVKYTPVTFQNLSQSTESVQWPLSAVTANYSRIILHAVGYDALFVVERAHNIVGKVQELSTGFMLRLAVNASETTASVSRVQIEPGRIFADNSPMGLPSFRVHHASPSPLNYTRLKQARDSDEGGIRIYDEPIGFVQAPVAVSWQNHESGQESSPLLSLLHGEGSKMKASSVKATKDGRGIDATDTTGLRSFCLRISKPLQRHLVCFGVQFDCDVLLASHKNEIVEGVALGCKAAMSDFTFTKIGAGGALIIGEPVLRPMRKPSFSPSLPMFSGVVRVSLQSPEHTEGAAELRYTLDGTDPTRNSTLYTSPIIITSTTGIKARAFCSTTACSKLAPRPDWAADGTRLSAVSYGTYIKAPDPTPVAAEELTDVTSTGLCVSVSNSTGSWSELYSFAGSATQPVVV
eukprot:COSAG05_NODE_142_length_16591_cov_6.726837_12_plen_1394_part_00